MAEMRREALRQDAGGLDARSRRVVATSAKATSFTRRQSRGGGALPPASAGSLRRPFPVHMTKPARMSPRISAGGDGEADATEKRLEGRGRKPGPAPFRDRGEQGTQGPCSRNRT